jgi:hypothetical protein
MLARLSSLGAMDPRLGHGCRLHVSGIDLGGQGIEVSGDRDMGQHLQPRH